jgi:mannose-6-phosphate isomerase-like protein (cupin superfamily)
VTAARLVDRAEVARRWADRGFSCEVWVDPPGREWLDYAHGTDELVMVLEGEVEFEIGGRRHRPAPGEELLIPAGTRHSVRTSPEAGSRWLYGYRR